jgi:hypothetical protein
LETVSTVVGGVFFLTFIPFYWAIAHQIRDTWVKGRPNDLSAMAALFGMLNCIMFPLYGSVQRPIQWVNVVAMSPVTLLWPGLWLQRHVARPSWGLGLLWATGSAATLGIGAVGIILRGPTASLVNIVGFVSALIGLGVAVLGGGAQYLEDRKVLKSGRKPELTWLLYASTAGSYSVGVFFAAITGQVWLLVTQLSGALLWGACLFQRMRSTRLTSPKVAKIEAAEVFFP